MARRVDAQAVPQPPQQEALQEAAFQTARRVTTLVTTLFVALASFATLPFEIALITTLLSSVVVYNLTRLFPENSRFVTVFHRTVVVESHSAPLLWHQRAIRFFAPVYYYRAPSPPRHQVGRAIHPVPAAFRPVSLRQSPPPLRQAAPPPYNPRGPIVGQPHPSIAASARPVVPPPQARQPHHSVGPNAASATQMPSSISAVPPLRISLPPAPSAPPLPAAPPLPVVGPSSAFARAVAPPQPQARHAVGPELDLVSPPPSRSASARPNLSPFPRPPTPRPSLRKSAEPHHAVGERTTPPARNISSSHRPPQSSYAFMAARTPPEIGTRPPSATRPTREGREAVGIRKRK